MAGKRGRPSMRAYGVWRSSDVVERRIAAILKQREPDSEETMTDAVYGARRLGRGGLTRSPPKMCSA